MLSLRAKKIVLATGVAGTLFLLVAIFFVSGQSVQKKADNNLAAVATIKKGSLQEYANLALPVQLKIPKINIDTAIEHVGLTSSGAMDVPKDPTQVAWFNHGPRPGEVGSAVISGHYRWKNNTPVIFNDLHLLQKGDRVSVVDAAGVTTTFLVREVRVYGLHDNAAGVFTSSDGKAHLNLITCQGVWDNVKKSYLQRLVVFTDKEITN